MILCLLILTYPVASTYNILYSIKNSYKLITNYLKLIDFIININSFIFFFFTYN